MQNSYELLVFNGDSFVRCPVEQPECYVGNHPKSVVRLKKKDIKKKSLRLSFDGSQWITEAKGSVYINGQTATGIINGICNEHIVLNAEKSISIFLIQLWQQPSFVIDLFGIHRFTIGRNNECSVIIGDV